MFILWYVWNGFFFFKKSYKRVTGFEQINVYNSLQDLSSHKKNQVKTILVVKVFMSSYKVVFEYYHQILITLQSHQEKKHTILCLLCTFHCIKFRAGAWSKFSGGQVQKFGVAGDLKWTISIDLHLKFWISSKY